MIDTSKIFDSELGVKYLIARNSGGVSQGLRFCCRKGMREYSRLFYVKNSTINFYYPNTDRLIISAQKGDIVYLPSNIEYDSVWSNPENIDFVTIIFNLSDADNLPFTVYDKICIMAHDTNQSLLVSFEKFHKIFSDGGLGYKFMCRSLFWQILFDVLSQFTKNSYEKKSTVYKGILYIENNYTSDFDVNELFKMCNMSPSAFRQKFKDIVGMTPVEYKNYLKTKKAIELLSSDEFNISEVSDILGFCDPYYFSKQFKHFWGCSPKKYKP